LLHYYTIKKKIKDNTKAAYLLSIKKLLTFIHKPLVSMTEFDISNYLSWYENKGEKKIQPSTYNNERRFLSAFFAWLRKSRLIADNPVESIDPMKMVRKPIDYFQKEEIIRLRDACKNVRERALIEVLRSTGARVGELIEIKVDQIEWNTGDIVILSEKSDCYRTLYLDEDSRYYLREYLQGRKTASPYMFPQSRAPYGQMHTCGIRSLLKSIGKRAGIECRVYPHKLRKTLGMQLRNAGADLGSIQEIMGHANPATTAQYYAQSTPETLRNIRRRVA